MDSLYVVMWEEWDGSRCNGADMFYSLDKSKAELFMHSHYAAKDLTWNSEADMYVVYGKYHWQKMYVVVRPLDEEI